MNKLKLLYDVVKTMKDKEEIKGTLQAKGEKNHTQIFSFTNEFARNLLTGATKAKISTQFDCDGNQAKHESYTEFNMQDSHGHHMFPGFKGHMHHHGYGHCHKHGDLKPQGFKDKLNRIACVLNILNQITIIEQDDKSLLLSFNTSDMPAEMKKTFQEKMQHHHSFAGKSAEHHRFMQELGHITTSVIEVNVRINQKYEVEKVAITVNGKCEDAPVETLLSFKGELSLEW